MGDVQKSDGGDRKPMWTGRKVLTDEQMAFLASNVPPDKVKLIQMGGHKYVEKEYLAQTLNELFGPDNWDRETVETNHLYGNRLKMTSTDKTTKATVDGYVATYMARVRLTVRIEDDDGRVRTVVREGTGTCSYMQRMGDDTANVSPGEPTEIAVKGAETDAFKRACATWGRRLGMDIDEQEAVSRLSPSQARMAEARMAAESGAPTGRPGLRAPARADAKQAEASSDAAAAGQKAAADTSEDATAAADVAAQPGKAGTSGQAPAPKAQTGAVDLTAASQAEPDPWDQVAAESRFAKLDKDGWMAELKTMNDELRKNTLASFEVVVKDVEDSMTHVVGTPAEWQIPRWHQEIINRMGKALDKSPVGADAAAKLRSRLTEVTSRVAEALAARDPGEKKAA